MGYPVYKLLRAVNRQYPNNGFINHVDVREDTYDTNNPETNKIIDEDLRDLINEAIQETYINIAVDEVYSFPTVPGQNQYVLPDDCDLRDIQEVTRTFWMRGGPFPPPPHGGPGPGPEVWFEITFYANGGTGEMDPIPMEQGSTFTFPECGFTPPTGKQFTGWDVNGTSQEPGGIVYQPGDEIEMQQDMTVSPIWGDITASYTYTFMNVTPAQIPMELFWITLNGEIHNTILEGQGGSYAFTLNDGETLGDYFSRVYIVDFFGDIDNVDLTRVVHENILYQRTQHTIGSQGWRVITYYDGARYGTLHYQPVGGSEQTIDISTSSDPFTFHVPEGSTIADVYNVLSWYYGSELLENIRNHELHDEEKIVVIPCVGPTIGAEPTQPDPAVPVVTPDPEEPGDNGDGGEGGNPLEDLVVDPVDGGGGNPLDDNNGAEPVVEPDPEEPIGG